MAAAADVLPVVEKFLEANGFKKALAEIKKESKSLAKVHALFRFNTFQIPM